MLGFLPETERRTVREAGARRAGEAGLPLPAPDPRAAEQEERRQVVYPVTFIPGVFARILGGGTADRPETKGGADGRRFAVVNLLCAMRTLSAVAGIPAADRLAAMWIHLRPSRRAAVMSECRRCTTLETFAATPGSGALIAAAIVVRRLSMSAIAGRIVGSGVVDDGSFSAGSPTLSEGLVSVMAGYTGGMIAQWGAIDGYRVETRNCL